VRLQTQDVGASLLKQNQRHFAASALAVATQFRTSRHPVRRARRGTSSNIAQGEEQEQLSARQTTTTDKQQPGNKLNSYFSQPCFSLRGSWLPVSAQCNVKQNGSGKPTARQRGSRKRKSKDITNGVALF
jgi:hypothetical protein